MKKIIALVTVLIILSSFAGCSQQPRQVPAGYLTQTIEEILQAEDIDSTYTYTAAHSYNADTKTDSVTMELRVNYPYADLVTTVNCRYTYIDSLDMWTQTGTSSYTNWAREYKADKYLKTFRSSGTDDFGNTWDWELTVHSLDLDAGTITCSYDITLGADNLHAEGYDTFNLSTGDWGAFIIQGDTGRMHVILDKDIGIYIYKLYGSTGDSGSNDGSNTGSSGNQSSTSGTLYNFYGLEIYLDDSYVINDTGLEDIGYGQKVAEVSCEGAYSIYIQFMTTGGESYSITAQEYADAYYQGITQNVVDTLIQQTSVNGTPCVIGMREDGGTAGIVAFYVDGSSCWQISIAPCNYGTCNESELFSMVAGITCHDPHL